MDLIMIVAFVAAAVLTFGGLHLDRRSANKARRQSHTCGPAELKQPDELFERSPMATVEGRITMNADQCGGRPCVREMRIRVSDVLDMLASGRSPKEVLQELPDLEPEDILACLRFASRRLDHPTVAV